MEPASDSRYCTYHSENLERDETVHVVRFLSESCGCDLANGPCNSTFTAEYIESYRCQCSELSRAELDMAILGQLAAFTNNSTQSVHSTRYRHTPANRQRAYMTFWQSGRRVCKKTFLLLHTISEKRFRNLQQSFRENGLTPRCHGNTRRLPANTIAFTDTQRVVEFLHTYAATLMPMLFCYQAEFLATSASTCSCCPPALQRDRCGSSTLPPFKASVPLTIKLPTPLSAPSGDVWCLRSWSPNQ